MQAQINPPVQQWHWTNNYNNNAAPYNNVENWLYNVRGVSDGGTVGVGFSGDLSVATNVAAAVKVDVTGKQIWSRVYTGFPVAYGAYGTLYAAAEVSDGYILVGGAGLTGGGSAILVIKVDKNTGLAVVGWPKFFDRTNLPNWNDLTTSPRGKSVEVIYTSSVATGLVICGENLLTATPGGCIDNTEFCRQRGAFIMKLTLAGALDNTFATNGWQLYQRAGGGAADVQKTGVSHLNLIWQGGIANSTALGIIASGMTINGSLLDRDGFVMRCDMVGTLVYAKSYSEHQTTGCDYNINNSAYAGGYVDVGTPEAPYCTFTGVTDTENDQERAAAVYPVPGGTEALVTMACDVFVKFGGRTLCTNVVIPSTDSYFENDVALFRIDIATGAPMTTAPAPKNVGRMDGIDYTVRSVLTDNGTNVVVMGNNENFPTDLKTDLIKVSVSSFAQQWRRQYMPAGVDITCTFGLTTSIDGGLVVGGNNELNGEDYFMLKMGNDCGTNTGLNTYPFGTVDKFTAPAGITNWTNVLKSIRGEVRIPSGSTLNINGTSVISFADTRAYNDYDFLGGEGNFGTYVSLAPWNSQPTKIVIMPGGTLNIGGTARLTSLNSPCANYSNMWEGIEVWGTPSSAQTVGPSAQAKFTQAAGTTVEKMFTGINAFRNRYDMVAGLPEHVSNDQSMGGGGIVQITSGTLLNNRNGVWMGPYNLAPLNASTFTGAVFKQDALLADITFADSAGNRLGTDRFFEAVQCNKVVFKDCKFKGFSTLLKQYRGYGIRPKDSEVQVYTTSTTVPPFNFEDLNFAAFGTGAVTRMNIHDSRFNNNQLAIFQKGGDGGNFYNNTINVPIGVSPNVYTGGIRADGNTNVNITSNIITGMGTGALLDFNRGIYVMDAGVNASFVGFNTLDKMKIGQQTVGINGTSGNNTLGLALQCNTHKASNYLDIVVNGTGVGVLAQQGQGCNPQTQSGNTFADQTGCGTPAAENISSGIGFTYFGVSPSTTEPVCRTSNVAYTGCNPGNSANCTGSNLVCTTAACNSANITAMNAETDAEKKEILRNRIIDYYITVDSLTKAITQLTAWNNASSKHRLVGMYLRTRQWANAQTALNAIGVATGDDAAFTAVYQTLIDIGNSGTTILGYTPAQKSALVSVANGTTQYRHTAQGILNAASGTPITLIWEEPDGTTGSTIAKSMERPTVFGDLGAMPNPFNGTTTITCPLPDGASHVTLTVTDLQGRVIEQHVVAGGTGQLLQVVSSDGKPDGVYLCSITADGTVLGITRIVVQH